MKRDPERNRARSCRIAAMSRIGGTQPGTPRLALPALELLRRTAGSPRDLATKIARLARTLRALADHDALDARLSRLVALGHVERAPTRLQLVVGSIDMLRFWIEPAARDYYARRGIGFGLHQVLRVLDDPASMVDPTGFLVDRDVIIGHLMQVVHANPAYDLQLLESHEDGLEALERQVRAMLDGTHPRARSIGAIVEEPDYHARLLEYVRAFRDDPRAAHAPVRENVVASDHFRRIEQTFGTLPGAMRYFARLPTTALGAARHLLTVREFPKENF
ncbi:hypothetical protein DB32_002418 [Sandaracinus amylolyticus]|uniref:Uncharacterized protein n=2 Tax=Sandaracinus amylolyticus TaxID=927083 RepID=A0A0F6SEI8_9BACT|nr:hypothetical protein DB32_002418 [Sandaracinus amylolyticus]